MVVADQSITIQRVIEMTFRKRDIEITHATTVQRLIQTLDSGPTMLILDSRFFGADLAAGFHTVSPVLRRQNVFTILLTSPDDTLDIQQIQRWGIDDFLVKPLDNRELSSKVDSHLMNRVEQQGPILQEKITNEVRVAPPDSDEIVELITGRIESQLQEETARLERIIEDKINRSSESIMDRLLPRVGATLAEALEDVLAKMAGLQEATSSVLRETTQQIVPEISSLLSASLGIEIASQVKEDLPEPINETRLLSVISETLQPFVDRFQSAIKQELAAALTAERELLLPHLNLSPQLDLLATGITHSMLPQFFTELQNHLRNRDQQALAHSENTIRLLLDETLSSLVARIATGTDAEIAGVREAITHIEQQLPELAKLLRSEVSRMSEIMGEQLLVTIVAELNERLRSVAGDEQKLDVWMRTIEEELSGISDKLLAGVTNEVASLRQDIGQLLPLLIEVQAPLTQRLDGLADRIIAGMNPVLQPLLSAAGQLNDIERQISTVKTQTDTALAQLSGMQDVLASGVSNLTAVVSDSSDDLLARLVPLVQDTVHSALVSQHLPEEIEMRLQQALDSAIPSLITKALASSQTTLEKIAQTQAENETAVLEEVRAQAQKSETLLTQSLTGIHDHVLSIVGHTETRLNTFSEIVASATSLLRENFATLDSRADASATRTLEHLNELQIHLASFAQDMTAMLSLDSEKRNGELTIINGQLAQLRERLSLFMAEHPQKEPDGGQGSANVESLHIVIQDFVKNPLSRLQEQLGELEALIRTSAENPSHGDALVIALNENAQHMTNDLNAFKAQITQLIDQSCGTDNQRVAFERDQMLQLKTQLDAAIVQIHQQFDEILISEKNRAEQLSERLSDTIADLKSEVQAAFALGEQKISAQLVEMIKQLPSAEISRELSAIRSGVENLSQPTRPGPQPSQLTDELGRMVEEAFDQAFSAIKSELQRSREASSRGLDQLVDWLPGTLSGIVGEQLHGHLEAQRSAQQQIQDELHSVSQLFEHLSVARTKFEAASSDGAEGSKAPESLDTQLREVVSTGLHEFETRISNAFQNHLAEILSSWPTPSNQSSPVAVNLADAEMHKLVERSLATLTEQLSVLLRDTLSHDIANRVAENMPTSTILEELAKRLHQETADILPQIVERITRSEIGLLEDASQ